MEKEQKQQPDKLNFSFRELFNNSNGQSVAALVVAFAIVFVGLIAFIYCILVGNEYITHCVTLIGLGVGIFTVRNFKNNE